MLESMVDILISNYYYPKLAKKSQGILESNMIVAFDGWPFSNRGPVKPEANSRIQNTSLPSTSVKAFYLRSHKLVYPLGLLQLVAPLLVD